MDFDYTEEELREIQQEHKDLKFAELKESYRHPLGVGSVLALTLGGGIAAASMLTPTVKNAALRTELGTASALTPAEKAAMQSSDQSQLSYAAAFMGITGLLAIAFASKFDKFIDNGAQFCAKKHMAVADYFNKDKKQTPQI